MPQLKWDDIGERYFEAGVDRGVLYLSDNTGVAWNGLTSVKEASSGGEPAAYYIDGVKYLNFASSKEFFGSIEAFTYPDEFAEYDGWLELGNGLSVDEQNRKSFGLSYRTLIGNDVDGLAHGYKIHIVYNALATPTDGTYATLGDTPDPLSFSWAFTTTPIRVPGLKPLAHITIDSTKTNPTQLKFIEDYLYGTPPEMHVIDGYLVVSAGQVASLPPLEVLLDLFANPVVTLNIQANRTSGISDLTQSESMTGDLVGRLDEGIYKRAPGSRLTEIVTPDIDGGNATSTYLPENNVDGGNATSTYSAEDTIDGGFSDSTYAGLNDTGIFILS
jgi:hypothetical protein